MGKVPEDWKKQVLYSQNGKKANLRNCSLVSLTSVSATTGKQVFPKAVSRHVREKTVFGNRCYGSTKGKSNMNDMIYFPC